MRRRFFFENGAGALLYSISKVHSFHVRAKRTRESGLATSGEGTGEASLSHETVSHAAMLGRSAQKRGRSFIFSGSEGALEQQRRRNLGLQLFVVDELELNLQVFVLQGQVFRQVEAQSRTQFAQCAIVGLLHGEIAFVRDALVAAHHVVTSHTLIFEVGRHFHESGEMDAYGAVDGHAALVGYAVDVQGFDAAKQRSGVELCAGCSVKLLGEGCFLPLVWVHLLTFDPHIETHRVFLGGRQFRPPCRIAHFGEELPRDQGNAPRDGDHIAFARFCDERIGIGGGMQGVFGALRFVGAARKEE